MKEARTRNPEEPECERPEEIMDLSIVVPCYNEAGNLQALIARFRDLISDRPNIEVVLVNNGSTDDSAAVFAVRLRPGERVRVVNVQRNRGYGFGILAGLRAARGAFLAWTHADLQTDPADVLAAYDLIRKHMYSGKCFVRGRRIGRPAVDRLFTAGMAFVASTLLRTPLHDINAQPKLFPRAFLFELRDPPKDFSLDVYALYRAGRAGYRILEVPVQFGQRTAGKAKGGGTLRGKYTLTRRTLKYLFALRKRVRAI
jgi:glycosyltransferase involved in cell wall biosynthesis